MAFLIDLAGEVLGENEMANRQPEKWKETLALTPKQATSGPIPDTQHSPTFSCIELCIFFVRQPNCQRGITLNFAREILAGILNQYH